MCADGSARTRPGGGGGGARSRGDRLKVLAKLAAAVAAAPRLGHLRPLAEELLWLVPAIAIIGFGSGLLRWAPALDEATFQLALIAIVAPALGEELLFRGAMLPSPRPGTPMPWLAILWSTALFIVWHPVQVFIHGEAWAHIVLDPAFLACAGLLGIACARVYWRSGSIWSAVLLHWVVVVAWKALFGAPSPWSG